MPYDSNSEEYDFSGQEIDNKGHDHSIEIDANL